MNKGIRFTATKLCAVQRFFLPTASDRRLVPAVWLLTRSCSYGITMSIMQQRDTPVLVLTFLRWPFSNAGLEDPIAERLSRFPNSAAFFVHLANVYSHCV